MSKKTKDAVVAAAHAFADLNTFASVVTILEGGHLYTPGSHDAAEAIIKICHGEQQKHLRKYDSAVARACAK